LKVFNRISAPSHTYSWRRYN